MILGKAEMKVTHATLVAALQLYFGTQVFASGKAPVVTSIGFENTYEKPEDRVFKVTLEEPAPAVPRVGPSEPAVPGAPHGSAGPIAPMGLPALED